MTYMSDSANVYGKVVARAWSDSEFKARLRSDPRGALTEMGVEVDGDLAIKIVEDTPGLVHLVIPSSPVDSVGLGISQMQGTQLCAQTIAATDRSSSACCDQG